MSDVCDQVAEALAGRRDQRAFVEELAAVWGALRSEIAELDRGMDAASRALSSISQPGDEYRRLGALVADFAAAGRGAIADIAHLAAQADADLDAVVGRVNRETVNIGVLGLTKAGKSTLLRTITNLPDDVIPSAEHDPVTATPSIVYHSPGVSSADLSVHTWESFRDEYLAPLHSAAGLTPAPRTPAQFADFFYPETADPDSPAETQKFLGRLSVAQTSFASYSGLLRGGHLSVPLGELRPFVAYPVEGRHDLDHRPYHAVRGARIDSEFPNLAVTGLGLVDLPGGGEAGLDVERQFLRGIRDEVDLLLLVKRPTVASAFVTDEDWQTIQLADTARVGVSLGDFLFIVVNRDPEHLEPGLFDNALHRIKTEADRRRIRVLPADVADEAEVNLDVMEPVLAHLAANLAEMDLAAITGVLEQVEYVAATAAALSQDIQVRVYGWRAGLPNADDAFRRLAVELCDQMADDLERFCDKYDQTVDADQPIEELARGIAEAAGQLREFVANGLGKGSREAWESYTKGATARRPLEIRQDEFYRVRAEAYRVISGVELALDRTVEILWAEAADLLRCHLTDVLVPAGESRNDGGELCGPLAELRLAALDHHAPTIADALAQLMNVRVDYGSIVLRVAGPILRGITWDDDAEPLVSEADAAPAAADASAAGGRRNQDGARSSRLGGAAPARRGRFRLPGGGAASPSGENEGTRAFRSSQQKREIYDEITDVVNRRVDELEKALLEEARYSARVLAAAAQRFFDALSHTNDIENEYGRLCAPARERLWPAMFEGGPATVTAELARLDELARAVDARAAQLTDLLGSRRPR